MCGADVTVIDCRAPITSRVWFVNMWLDAPDNCGTIFNLDDRWSEWVHWFATLPVGNDIKSPPPPLHLKLAVTRQQQAEPTCFCWEHARPPCQQSSPSSGFPDNSCSVLTVITSPHLSVEAQPRAQKRSRLAVNAPTHRKKMLLICFLMKARSPRNFPYIRCRMVFRKSLSLGSSLSNSSSSWDERGGKKGQNWTSSRLYIWNLVATMEEGHKGRCETTNSRVNGVFFPSQHLDFHLE